MAACNMEYFFHLMLFPLKPLYELRPSSHADDLLNDDSRDRVKLHGMKYTLRLMAVPKMASYSIHLLS